MWMFDQQYNISFLEAEEPTQAMLDGIVNGLYTIDICLMEGANVLRGAELDIRRALDRKGSGKFDGTGS